MAVRSGEEDERVVLKERVKLFRWDREGNQWKERGVGDMKILHHPVRDSFRLLMRRDQILKVCANQPITSDLKLLPMQASNNAFTWTATDYSGETFVRHYTSMRFRAQIFGTAEFYSTMNLFKEKNCILVWTCYEYTDCLKLLMFLLVVLTMFCISHFH